MNNIISNCLLCEERSLHVYGEKDAQIMQCINCGYTSTSNFIGDFEKNEEYKKLNGEFKAWTKNTGDRFWIPTIMTLPSGMLYPVDEDGEMKWAYAPMVNIAEDEQEKYPDGNGGYYSQRYDTDNQSFFDNFFDSMTFLTQNKEEIENGNS